MDKNDLTVGHSEGMRYGIGSVSHIKLYDGLKLVAEGRFEDFFKEPNKRPVLLDEKKRFILERIYHRDDINFEYHPIEIRLVDEDDVYIFWGTHENQYIHCEIKAFLKAFDYLNVKYEVVKRKVNEKF